jgi:transcriptional regulator with XRE-family HTH domain
MRTELLEKALERKGLSQVEFARLLRLSPQFVSALLKGKRQASTRTLIDIGEILSVPVEDLAPGRTVVRSEAARFVPQLGLDRVDLEMLTAYLTALAEAREVFLLQTLRRLDEPGLGKADTKRFDAACERAIVTTLLAFSSRAAIFSEETGVLGRRDRARDIAHFCDPFDRSVAFLRLILAREGGSSLVAGEHDSVKDLLADSAFPVLETDEAPMGSITYVVEGKVAFNCLLDYVTGIVYVACKGLAARGDISHCRTAQDFLRNSIPVTFLPRSGHAFSTYLGTPGSVHAGQYQQLLASLGFEIEHHVGIPNPGGPGRILSLSSGCQRSDVPSFILSNGEKVHEWINYFAWASAADLSVVEFASGGYEAREDILQAPPKRYSIFDTSSGELRLDIDLLLRLGNYRGAIAVTHRQSSSARAILNGMPNSRELLPL